MGAWTRLDRYDRQTFERALAKPSSRTLSDRLSDDSAGNRADLGHVSAINAHRAWHALHVALTGEAEEGPPPMSYVLWTTPGADEATMSAALHIHDALTVRLVADHLAALQYDSAVADLYAAHELGVYVYSFTGWADGEDIVECGLFRRVFDDVRQSYRLAASEDQVVVVRRG